MNEANTLAPAEAPVDVDKLDTAKPLAVIFAPYQTTLEKWEAKVQSLVVTDINQKTEMAQARLARLELKSARVEMEKTRLGLVEHLKARTGKIDETARTIRKKLETLEAKLLESEQFAERHAAKLKAELKIKREANVRELSDDPIYGDLSDLTEPQFDKFLEDVKFLRQAKLDAAAKAEADRKAKEEAERLERERIATENAKLKAEAVERERLAEIERKRLEAERAEERRKFQEEAERKAAIAKKERDEAAAKAEAERKRLEAIAAEERKKAQAESAAATKARAELAAKAEAEATEKRRLAAERKAAEKAANEAANAPDKAKVAAYVAAIRNVQIPTLKALQLDLPKMVESFTRKIEVEAELAAMAAPKPQLDLVP